MQGHEEGTRDLVRIDHANVQEVSRQLQNRRGDVAGYRGAVALVQAARERGELSQVFRLAADGADLELFCDANDDDASAADALEEMHPRELAVNLLGVPRGSIQWRLAPVNVVVAALLLEASQAFPALQEVGPVSYGDDDDGDDEDDDSESAEGRPSIGDHRKPGGDEGDSADDAPPLLTAFIEAFREGFNEIFEPTVGLEVVEAIRPDGAAALDAHLESYVSNVRSLLDPAIVNDDRLHGLCQTDVEDWVQCLVGGVIEQELVIEDVQPVNDTTVPVGDSFEV